MAVDGTWTINFRTPAGERQAELVFRTDGPSLTGTFDGDEFENGSVDGDKLSFSALLTSPVKVKVKCKAAVSGDTITGKARAGIMTIPFTGTRTMDQR